MAWDLQEALDYYKRQGAPSDQLALKNLLGEIQQENGGSVPGSCLGTIAEAYAVKETFLRAMILRYPSLRLADTHCLEICCGPNCPKRARLADFVEKTYGEKPGKFEVRHVGCMRMCGKGPNIRWDGRLYHGADEKLIRSLVESI